MGHWRPVAVLVGGCETDESRRCLHPMARPRLTECSNATVHAGYLDMMPDVLGDAGEKGKMHNMQPKGPQGVWHWFMGVAEVDMPCS